jgi:superfamily II DNA or RNA helicase/very-short-patch-repair endonuclease
LLAVNVAHSALRPRRRRYDGPAGSIVTSLKLIVDQQSPADAKVALFRSLFRGREDVYPRRFESRKTGKSGYAPACANEWVRGVCEKPRIKCAECPSRQFLSLNERVIRWHLSGQDDAGKSFVAGVYPMLLDETCFFLAIDFDKQNWTEDAQGYLETCRRMSIPAALERSRSGRGGHVWSFFSEAIPAALARRLGSYLLTESMTRRPDIGFESYDRFFPSQDTLPRGGFGSLIALPLQKQAREQGNSVFLDAQLAPFADQWAFLSSIARLSRSRVEEIVAAGERQGRILSVRLPSDDEDSEPWTAPPSRRRAVPVEAELPARVELVLANEIYVPKEPLTPWLRNRLIQLAAFQNPEFYAAQSMRLPTYGKPRIVSCAEDHGRFIGLPRGCLDELRDLLGQLGVGITILDERFQGEPVEAAFHGDLRPDQQRAAEALMPHDIGVLAATTAFGKTVVAAWLIAERRVNTLVLVHRRQLLDQWVERLSTFLNVPQKAIGRIGGGRNKPTGRIDVAVIQSLVRRGVVDDRVGTYGHLIVDECHHVSAHSFEQVARRAKSRFVLGLSATVTRKDGHQPIIFMQCGPIRHRVDAKAQAALRPFRHSVIVCPTSFAPAATEAADARVEFQALYTALAENDVRNRAICDSVVEAVQTGRSPLVLTERHEHLERLAALLSGRVRHIVILRGGSGKKARQAVVDQMAAIPVTEERVLLGTGKYIGEGFDDARLDTLFITLPISWRGTIAQYVGRLHRLHDGKRDVRVYDFADLNVRMLSRMFDRRCRGYEALGYEIVLPASAIPGWPVDVPLPADPLWKRDYSTSVRRLVRDGVDVPLAGLFVIAARSIPVDAEGASRARSSSEAFFYRRLETLGGTRGRFRLNAELPIPFDGRGRMEVDLLCEDGRLAIEIDGALHLGDAEAYRRDRRKDRLLQEHGYTVLRFLAEDLARDLDVILDAVLRWVGALEPASESPTTLSVD